MLKNFNELVAQLKEKNNKKTVIVAAAQTSTAVEAAVLALNEGLANSILVGDEKSIRHYLENDFPDFKDRFEIVNTDESIEKACSKSVQLIREGRGDLILKGKADTAMLLRAVLNKEQGLTTGNIISDVLAYETPERVMLMSDGGINLYPTLEEKISIIKNAVQVAHALGNPMPKVALLAAVEVINPKMPCTLDAAALAKMNERKQIAQCLIDGPLAIDNAIDLAAAKLKGIESEVAGDADILIAPNIEAGNILGKCLTYYCNFRVAHVVMGTKVPIIIASRADTAEVKMLSMALGIISA